MTVLIVQLKFLISFLIFFFFLIKVGGDATTSVNVRAVEEAVVLCWNSSVCDVCHSEVSQ